MNRLIKRGLLKRKKVDGVYRYYPLIEKKDLGRFGSFDDKMSRKGVTDLLSRLIQKEIANNPDEIKKLQKLLEQERKRLQQKK